MKNLFIILLLLTFSCKEDFILKDKNIILKNTLQSDLLESFPSRVKKSIEDLSNLKFELSLMFPCQVEPFSLNSQRIFNRDFEGPFESSDGYTKRRIETLIFSLEKIQQGYLNEETLKLVEDVERIIKRKFEIKGDGENTSIYLNSTLLGIFPLLSKAFLYLSSIGYKEDSSTNEAESFTEDALVNFNPRAILTYVNEPDSERKAHDDELLYELYNQHGFTYNYSFDDYDYECLLPILLKKYKIKHADLEEELVKERLMAFLRFSLKPFMALIGKTLETYRLGREIIRDDGDHITRKIQLLNIVLDEAGFNPVLADNDQTELLFYFVERISRYFLPCYRILHQTKRDQYLKLLEEIKNIFAEAQTREEIDKTPRNEDGKKQGTTKRKKNKEEEEEDS